MLDFDLSADEISLRTQSLIEKSNVFFENLKNVPSESVIAEWSTWDGIIHTQSSIISFAQHVHLSKDVRDASAEAQKMFEEHQIEINSRRDLFDILKKVGALEGELGRFREKQLVAFKLAGLELDEASREELIRIKKRLTALSVEFTTRLNNDDTCLKLTGKQLEGLPQSFLDFHKVEQDTFEVTMKYPDVSAVLKYAHSESTRKLVDTTNNQRCSQNVDLLAEATELRLKAAKLLGFESHADVNLLDNRMAKSPSEIKNFLSELRSKLTPLAQKELQTLKSLKERNGCSCFHSWDYGYYTRIRAENEFSIDEQLLQEYFPLDHVVSAMLEIYENVLSLKFEGTSARTWHPDVLCYAVKDNVSLLGCLYLDLHPRPGKYSHGACFAVQPVTRDQLAHTAIVTNFTAPTKDRPSLLKHDEVVVLFHELGHAMHQICSKTQLVRFSGTSVETDFVEAPSQMLENWCWNADVLKRLGRHYKDRTTIPDEMISALIRTRLLNCGLVNLRQIFFATFDLEIHSNTHFTADQLNQLYEKLRLEISLIKQPSSVYPVASFGHMVGGYDAGYYGYLWSQVFSADMFHSRFMKEGALNTCNSRAGYDYRREILEPGGSRDGEKSLIAFLGRKPSMEPFLKSLGL